MNLYNFQIPGYNVVDTVPVKGQRPSQLVRGPKPDLEDMRELFYPSVKTDINLEVGWYDIIHDQIFAERDICIALEIDYIHKPMSDWSAPTKQELLDLVNQIDYRLQYGDVLVHCLHGEDRTGMVCAAWRIWKNKWPVDAAIAEMKNNGFHTIPYFYWIPTLRELCA